MLDAEHGEESLRRKERLHGRDGLAHAAEDEPVLLPLEHDGNDAGAGLDPDLDELHRPRQDEGGAEHRMPCERNLGRRREDPDADVSTLLR